MGGFSYDDSLKLSDPHDESVVSSDDTLRHGSEGLSRKLDQVIIAVFV